MLPAHHILISSVARAWRSCWGVQPKLPSRVAAGTASRDRPVAKSTPGGGQSPQSTGALQQPGAPAL